MNKVLKAILCILKNATIIIPLMEGVVHSFQKLVNPDLEDCKDAESKVCEVRHDNNLQN